MHPDTTPIHVGLGTAERFNLRVTYPGKEPRIVLCRAGTMRMTLAKGILPGNK